MTPHRWTSAEAKAANQISVAVRQQPPAQKQPRVKYVHGKWSRINADALAKLTKLSLPTPDETRGQLYHIRRTLGLARGHLAFLLGVSHDLLTQWELGYRKPSAIARRHIQMFHDNLERDEWKANQVRQVKEAREQCAKLRPQAIGCIHPT